LNIHTSVQQTQKGNKMKRYIPEVCSGNKTYATEENAVKAAEAKFGDCPDLTYIIMKAENGRFVPVFIGERSLQAGVHFHFHVLG
jgi:hypothetical protein